MSKLFLCPREKKIEGKIPGVKIRYCAVATDLCRGSARAVERCYLDEGHNSGGKRRKALRSLLHGRKQKIRMVKWVRRLGDTNGKTGVPEESQIYT